LHVAGGIATALYYTANRAVRDDDDSDRFHNVADLAKGAKSGERGARLPEPTGYRPGRQSL
jgi:hypothetical protein